MMIRVIRRSQFRDHLSDLVHLVAQTANGSSGRTEGRVMMAGDLEALHSSCAAGWWPRSSQEKADPRRHLAGTTARFRELPAASNALWACPRRVPAPQPGRAHDLERAGIRPGDKVDAGHCLPLKAAAPAGRLNPLIVEQRGLPRPVRANQATTSPPDGNVT
jgi:hypothetical protein